MAESFRIIGIAGKAGAGKDTFYEHVLKPRGFLRWQMTLHYKVWFPATNMAKTSWLFAVFDTAGEVGERRDSCVVDR